MTDDPQAKRRVTPQTIARRKLFESGLINELPYSELRRILKEQADGR